MLSRFNHAVILKPFAKPSSKLGADYESLALRSEGEDGKTRGTSWNPRVVCMDMDFRCYLKYHRSPLLRGRIKLSGYGVGVGL